MARNRWPGPIDGILRAVPMADIVGVILRSLGDVLTSMENGNGVPREKILFLLAIFFVCL